MEMLIDKLNEDRNKLNDNKLNEADRDLILKRMIDNSKELTMALVCRLISF